LFYKPKLLGVQNKKNEMGRACGMYGRQARCIMVLIRRPEGKPHLEGLGVDGMMIIIKGSARRGMGAWTPLKAIVNL
jgi:hypothetical protein